MHNMVKQFNYKGHHYKVVPVENSDEYSIIKDGRTSRRIKKEIAENAMQFVDKLF